jgi:hypothetical protein
VHRTMRKGRKGRKGQSEKDSLEREKGQCKEQLSSPALCLVVSGAVVSGTVVSGTITSFRDLAPSFLALS